MRVVRGLMAAGNGKLGQAIHHFDLPAITTCPGRSAVCTRVCYAAKGRFLTGPVRERLRWCLRQSRQPGFAARITAEIRRKGALVVRVHVAGDFYNPGYAAAWLAVFRACPATRFYFYTRSWRVPAIAVVLTEMAGLDNVRAWYSADTETGPPDLLPAGVRVAWLQVAADDGPPLPAALLFRVRRLRRRPVALHELPVLCPHEAPGGRDVNCGNCGRCWS
ncbi:MAG: hypothetical protein K2X87_24465 [Gemmataceae bacterium]|nr:hypothetical protein [Gemmataceae bacterium]